RVVSRRRYQAAATGRVRCSAAAHYSDAGNRGKLLMMITCRSGTSWAMLLARHFSGIKISGEDARPACWAALFLLLLASCTTVNESTFTQQIVIQGFLYANEPVDSVVVRRTIDLHSSSDN